MQPASSSPTFVAHQNPARQRAEAAQRLASDPDVSAFVSASAGSGKTKLLTDRLLRLMLAGADPAAIQCLTFTKAAAAEMALRLQAKLGGWVTMPDAALDSELHALQVTPNIDIRAKARALFAIVLDLPGGMRISTIHAFCQSLLGRFPLEADLPPNFQLAEERDAAQALDEAREDVFTDLDEDLQAAVDQVAAFASLRDLSGLLSALNGKAEALAPLVALPQAQLWQYLRSSLNVAATDRGTLLAAEIAALAQHSGLRDALRIISAEGAATVQTRAVAMLDFLALHEADQIARWDDWRACLLTQKGEPRAASGLCNDKLAKSRPGLRDTLADVQARLVAAEEQLRALHLAELSFALLTLAKPVLALWRQRESAAGLLGYDDLIRLASRLLVDPGAGWVLYKLDSGLDHLLLDEAQDTSPAQWRIADALTGEFFAGFGARSIKRSFFAVGDPKQSIYSFQGADKDQFEHWRGIFKHRAHQGEMPWRDVSLDVSFRSTAPVLALVDAVFADPLSAFGVVEHGETLRHVPDRSGHAGMIEFWPLAPQIEADALPPWQIADRNLALHSPAQQLAETLADWIATQTNGAMRLESRDRMLRPGDVLVLVRRRGAFDRALVKALKSRGVPVAGLDRMILTSQPAVQDMLTLLDMLLLPQDDLSLACVLTSPLGGLTDASLMDLALARTGSLWSALRARADENPVWRQALDFLQPLLNRADYATPHTLLADILGPRGGRARLLQRLGPECAEPLDELLAAAFRYTQIHPPSLQGFLHWLRRSGSEVKRQPEEAGDTVRIMTVHGAKGLQAPLVVLPDTTALPDDDANLLWLEEGGVMLPVWCPSKALRSRRVADAGQLSRQKMVEEYNRLLYVALTRAEDRLLVCGWATRALPEESWYRQIARGFEALGAQTVPFTGDWPGDALCLRSEQTAPPIRHAARATAEIAAPLPGWARSDSQWPKPVLVREFPTRRPLAPSQPDQVRLGPVPPARSPLQSSPRDAALRRGRVVHSLLQYLPSLPLSDRADAATRFAAREWPDQPPAMVVAPVLAVVNDPALTPLFGPGSLAEQPISGLAGDMVVQGVIDRMAVLPDSVWLADFKTGRPPASAAAAPVAYLKQLAAYRALLAQIYPDRPVHCFLVWTDTGFVMPIAATQLAALEPGGVPNDMM